MGSRRNAKPAKMDRLAHSIREWGELTDSSRSFLYSEAAAGRLKLTKLGGKTVILHDDGMAWLRGEVAP